MTASLNNADLFNSEVVSFDLGKNATFMPASKMTANGISSGSIRVNGSHDVKWGDKVIFTINYTVDVKPTGYKYNDFLGVRCVQVSDSYLLEFDLIAAHCERLETVFSRFNKLNQAVLDGFFNLLVESVSGHGFKNTTIQDIKRNI